MISGFYVTYEIITEESAAEGDTAEAGFISMYVPLRDALRDLYDTAESCGGIVSIESNDRDESSTWITIYNSMAWQSGNYENRSLHIPDGITPSSRRRIVRLVRSGSFH